jgi:3-phenylpropionate/cinnamic acid dioxygenase small subunit
MNETLSWADVVEIQHLLYRIAATADTADDIEDYLDLLTPDAVFDFAEVPAIGLGAHHYQGRDELREGVLSRRAAGVQGPGTNTLHIVSDVAVEASAPAFARVHAAWQYFGLRDTAPALLTMGIYRNEVRRMDGRWLLARREVVVFG